MKKREAHNSWSLVLGEVAGIQLEVHVTFALVAVWALFALARRGASKEVLVLVATMILGVAVSLLLHELGHALVARMFGLKTREISLTPMGGFSNIDEMPETPRVQLLVVLAGPAVSLLLGGLLFAISAARGELRGPLPFNDTNANPVTQLAWFNVVLGGYNLLPIFPMDGGRALRAGFSFFMDYVRATRIASRIAQALSIALALAGLEYGPVVLFTAVWIWMSARSEVKTVRTRHALKSLLARDVMVTGPTLDADSTLEDASLVFRKTFQSEFPVMRGTDVVGVMGFKELVSGLEKHGAQGLVSAAMRTTFNGVDFRTPLEQVHQQMKDASDPMVMVTRGERYAGVLPQQNVDELLRIAKALEK
ncbi:MAG: M50 family metallopeptidase [Archangium sp.]|nr:M50 family metallopeptidase [Archangium sp.]